MNIGLVTDSTSDIPQELVEKFNIQIVPAILNIGEKSYEDGNGITREEFYYLLPKLTTPPTTSAPSVGSFQKRYELLLSSGAAQVISLHASSLLSGIFNAARIAAESFNKRVHVLDSAQITLGLGFQVLAAAQAIAEGTRLDEVLRLVEAIKARVRVVALLDTLEYLRRSGRVSWAKAKVGGLLNLKPLIGLRSGIVEKLGQARTRAQGILRLKETLNSWGPLEQLAILHSNAETAARQLLDDIKPKLAASPLVVNVTTIIGTHVGPNGLGIVALLKG